MVAVLWWYLSPCPYSANSTVTKYDCKSARQLPDIKNVISNAGINVIWIWQSKFPVCKRLLGQGEETKVSYTSQASFLQRYWQLSKFRVCIYISYLRVTQAMMNAAKYTARKPLKMPQKQICQHEHRVLRTGERRNSKQDIWFLSMIFVRTSVLWISAADSFKGILLFI